MPNTPFAAASGFRAPSPRRCPSTMTSRRPERRYFAAAGNAGSLPMSRASCWMMTLASLDRFKKIAANLNATVIIQHDARDIGKLPAFPAAAK